MDERRRRAKLVGIHLQTHEIDWARQKEIGPWPQYYCVDCKGYVWNWNEPDTIREDVVQEVKTRRADPDISDEKKETTG